MDKKVYMTPDMEVIEVKAQSALLAMSEGAAPDPNDPQDP